MILIKLHIILSFLWASPQEKKEVHVLKVADLTLYIMPSLSMELETLRHKHYSKKIAYRLTKYSPMIERHLKRQGVPIDMKYIAVLESALHSDAVSSAGAVGIWQIMPETGRELGLYVDRVIDDRKFPEESTKCAAKYLKRSYKELDNWLFVILSYNHGLAFAKKKMKEEGRNRKRYILDDDINWYLKRYLACVIAYRK